MTPRDVRLLVALDGRADRARRAEYLPFHLPEIGDEEIDAVVRTLRSGWLTTGPQVRAFEEQFAAYVGAPHAVAVNSATAALHLALEAAGIRDGDEVIVPTMTFAATGEVVVYLGATPVLADCDAVTLNIDPDAVEAAVTPRTRAIVPVHFAGHPCAMDRILEVAARHGLVVIDDAAHALPASWSGRAVGTMGLATAFSFYATKAITTGEGGMLTTADPALADRARMMSLHGISRDAWKRYTAEGSWAYEILAAGFKYNLTDIAAALGIEQLKKCTRFCERRRAIAARYDAGFEDVPELATPVSDPAVEHAWHLYVVQLELERLRIDRTEFVQRLRQRNIGASVHFIPLHRHPFYRAAARQPRVGFGNADRASERIVSLPIFSRMTDADVDDVIAAVRAILRESRR
jgi:perosamine synthetase